MPWHRLLILDVCLLGLMVLASRAALLIHEVGGHALPFHLLGARSVSIRLSLLGGGYVTPEFAAGARPTGAGRVVSSLGGIALNLMTGLAAWVAARRLRGLGRAFLLLFGVGSCGVAVSYLANGFYYGTGDPAGLAENPDAMRSLQWIWVLHVPLMAAGSFLAARSYLNYLAGHAALDTRLRRFGWTAATIGLVTGAYLGLLHLTERPDTKVSLVVLREQLEIEKETARRTTPAVVRPEEVAHRVPSPLGPVILLAAGLAGAVAGLWTASPKGEPAALSWRHGIACLALGASAVGGVAWIGS